MKMKREFKLSKFQKKFFEDNPNVDWPLCKCGCGKKVLINKTNTNEIFREYASVECSRKSKTISNDIVENLSNKEWLYNQRVILKKSNELIASELGISTTPVYKWCKKHDIKLRLNASNSSVLEKLSDKEWLSKKYNDEKLKCEEIAKELSTSKSTVSIFLNKHGIETRNPNFYDRKFIKVSKSHQEIVDFIKTIYDGEIKINDRSVLSGKELDIYIPEKKLAIEYNGVYWHIVNTLKLGSEGKKYHKNKMLDCRENGIDLFQIWSSQWELKKEIIKSMLRIKLHSNEVRKIPARKCEIREVSIYDKDTFLDENHLMGKDKSKIKCGLYYMDELVSLITFRTSRYNKSYDHELNRFSVKCNTLVQGGFTKLLNYFRKNHTGSIISYADLMYSNGNVYYKNNFKLIKETQPKYWYVKEDTEILEHRSSHMKKRYVQGEDSRTELEIMNELGYNRIYDCGVLSFVLE